MKHEPKVESSVIMLPRLMTVKEVAHFLNVSVRTVRTIQEQIGFMRVRGQVRFDPVHLDTYLRKRAVAA